MRLWKYTSFRLLLLALILLGGKSAAYGPNGKGMAGGEETIFAAAVSCIALSFVLAARSLIFRKPG
jgi:hypothetical protein